MGEWYDETEDYLYLRVLSIIFHDDDDDGDPEQEIKGIIKAAILPGKRHDFEIDFEWEAKLREIQTKGDE